ncbi:hypothetical protein RBB50_008793 [Rhinocladiella similis]
MKGEYVLCDWRREPNLPGAVFSDLLRALPKSCTSVEMDTGGTDSAGMCLALRDILPRLRHLRLRALHLCPQALPPAPLLQTCIISFCNYPRGYLSRRDEGCAYHEQDSRLGPIDNMIDQDASHKPQRMEIVRRLDSLYTRDPSRMPNLWRCRILVDMTHPAENQLTRVRNRWITVFDIRARLTHCLPICKIEYIPFPSTQRQYPWYILKEYHGIALVGSLIDLEDLLEEAWSVSTVGNHVPWAYLLEYTQRMGWEWLRYSTWKEPRLVEYDEDEPTFEMADMLAALDAQYHTEPPYSFIRNHTTYPAFRASQLQTHQFLREEWLRNGLARDVITKDGLDPPFTDQ